MKREVGFADVINLMLAVWLFLSPWIAGFAGMVVGASTAWLTAIAIAVVAIAALARLAEWEEWINLALGIWLLISPWAIGIASIQGAMMSLLLTGIAVAALAALEIWMLHRPPPRLTESTR